MTTTTSDLPKEILERAVNLRNALRLIFIELYRARKALSADEVASIVGHERAYVNMRLNQLEDMGYVKSIPSPQSKKVKLYEVC